MNDILENGTEAIIFSPSGEVHDGIVIRAYVDLFDIPRYELEIKSSKRYPINSRVSVSRLWVVKK